MKLRIFALVTVVFAALGSVSSSQGAVAISVGFAPPPLVAYAPPPVPVAGYIWTPGYWGWNSFLGTYYWVPGVWTAPPSVGLYWTPPWWGFDNGAYLFHEGYWGPTVGFYGGINYGYGYFGNGYWGGRWNGNVFAYNTAVVRVNKTVVTNTFVDRTVLANATTNKHASFNGPGGVQAQATAEQKAAAENASKAGPTSEQLARREAASKETKLQAKNNKGHVNPDAIQAFNKTHGQAETGAGKGAAGRETSAGAETKTATEHGTAASTINKKGAGAETKTKTAHERRNAHTAAGGGGTGGSEHRQPTLQSTKTKPHENFNAVNRRPTYAKPSGSQVGTNRQMTAHRPEQGRPVQGKKEEQGKKKKPANDQQPGGGY